jgi:hypothetical protein
VARSIGSNDDCKKKLLFSGNKVDHSQKIIKMQPDMVIQEECEGFTFQSQHDQNNA